MTGKPTKRRRLQMLHDVTKGDSYATLKEADDERKVWRYNGMIPYSRR